MENSEGCQHDFLEIRDGRYGYSELLDTVCSHGIFPPEMNSKGRFMWIHFKSDENIEHEGFKAVFEFVPRPENSSKYE